jgi:hypothetical protein
MDFRIRKLCEDSKTHNWNLYGNLNHQRLDEECEKINSQIAQFDFKIKPVDCFLFFVKTPLINFYIRADAGNCGVLHTLLLNERINLIHEKKIHEVRDIFKLFAIKTCKNLIMYSTASHQAEIKEILKLIGFETLQSEKELTNNNSRRVIQFHILNTNNISL